MHFSQALVAFFAAAACASPVKSRDDDACKNNFGPFGIMALRSASPIHFAQGSAARNSLFLNLPEQNATCTDGPAPSGAIFTLIDGNLYLYAEPEPYQQIFVDRSGMGQGIVGYTTGDQPLPRNAEREGWELDANNNLSFKGTGLLACPNSIDGAWRIWLSVGIGKPAGQEGCLGFSPRAIELTEPQSCEYTYMQ
ncbi:hypothetical protein SODALDRAFT_325724 [Sodiomyces alkalinus F11]|uniref:Cell wall protein PhiA n=1 Tax=Sodiomyces alkalinus (strain CBS 110278 / VKM F-3762 / F11) TaxID=1314773 RepID=A0A3N2PPT5_SODAK|nr:hypothetical protein SODALDRAFT_325724 [Sodiomyces alkalinus F11]ROT36376.1 hypothetical protein SODALDRAFT_325724 [Sodiomyces alkalinus F11]